MKAQERIARLRPGCPLIHFCPGKLTGPLLYRLQDREFSGVMWRVKAQRREIYKMAHEQAMTIVTALDAGIPGKIFLTLKAIAFIITVGYGLMSD